MKVEIGELAVVTNVGKTFSGYTEMYEHMAKIINDEIPVYPFSPKLIDTSKPCMVLYKKKHLTYNEDYMIYLITDGKYCSLIDETGIEPYTMPVFDPKLLRWKDTYRYDVLKLQLIEAIENNAPLTSSDVNEYRTLREKLGV